MNPIALFALSTILSIGSAVAQCIPSATWSGRFVLDVNRDPQGGVRVILENTPESHRHLLGRTVLLRSSRNDQRYDVTIGEKARATARTHNVVMPYRLDGWKQVSALESFAAARDNDIVQAEIVNPVVEGEILTTAEEPILLDGNERCLANFVSVDGETAVVRHYNRATGAFDGTAETVGLDFKRHLPLDEIRRVQLRGIVNHKDNRTGWDVYGYRSQGRFIVTTIEPHALYRVDAGMPGRGNGVRNLWRLPPKNESRQVVYQHGTPVASGTKYLVAHAFGSYNDAGMTLNKYRGHASIGFAEVIAHPLSGVPVYRLIYKQVYGQSVSGVFGGSYHSHAYQGNLYRGHSFIRPNVDVLYPISERLAEEIAEAMDKMAVNYRVGFGHGYSRVTLLTSCVRDTGNTIIDVLNKYPDRRNDELSRRLRRRLGKRALPPAKFRNVELLRDNEDMRLSVLAQARRNLTIAIPRNFQDAMMKAFLEDGNHPVVVLQANQIGDDMPTASPRAPDRINSFVGTLLSVARDWIFDKD